MNRREFLIYTAALACLPERTEAAKEERTHPDPPYLKLKQFIEPGNDEFAGEKEAQALKAALHAALESKTLANAAIGPTSYKQVASDLAEGIFEGAAREWRLWVEALGRVERAERGEALGRAGPVEGGGGEDEDCRIHDKRHHEGEGGVERELLGGVLGRDGEGGSRA